MKNHAVLHIKCGLFVKSLIFINDVHNSKKLPSLHVNLKRTKFSEVNTPSNRFFELNFLSLLYVIMVKRKVFCHFFGLWVGPSRMRCRHFKSESCARKNFVRFFARFSSPWSDICTTHASMTKKVRRGWDFFDLTKNHKIIKNGWSFPYLITFYVTHN